MREAFRVRQPLPGAYHIQDPMGICCTLLVGSRRALLLDTGYGLFNLPGAVAAITRLALTVLCSHGHHDHACGGAQFPHVCLHAADHAVCAHYTRPEQRARVLAQAEAKGVLPPALSREAYLAAGSGTLRILREERFDLGGLSAEVVHLPGHTPGSIGLYVPQRRLLLTGDSWNPTTWLFFAECEPVHVYARSLRAAMTLPFAHVLAPHEAALVPAERLRQYVAGLTRDTFGSAQQTNVPGHEATDTRACCPTPDTTLVFDQNKLQWEHFTTHCDG